MVVAGLLIVGVGAFVIPHLNPSMFNGTNSWAFGNGTHPFPSTNMPGFVGGVLTAVGSFGVLAGLIVFGSGYMLRIKPEHSAVWGVLMLIFSVLSFFGSGGFVIGAILGIVGGVMTLMWKRPGRLRQAPVAVGTVK